MVANGILKKTQMDDREFQLRSDAALDALNRRLAAVADEYEFDPDLNNGALTIEFEESGERFVVSPNAPVKQIWISALTKSFKLDWDDGQGAFVHPESGRMLDEQVRWAMQQRLGSEFEF